MTPYADTNFYARLYLRTPKLDKVQLLLSRALREESELLPVTWLHRVETLNAFQMYVFSGRSPGHLRVTQEQAAAAFANFCADMQKMRMMRPVKLEMNELESQFEELSLRHTAKHGFRTYDILHVSSALLLGCDTFWSFDQKASKLAALEGLQIQA